MTPKLTSLLYAISAGLIATVLVVSWSSVHRLRKTAATYNARLLPFAYYSLVSWTLWLLGYAPVAIQTVIPPSTNSLTWLIIDHISLALGTLNTACLWLAVIALYSGRRHRPRVVITVAFALWFATMSYLLRVSPSETHFVWVLVSLLDSVAFLSFIPALLRLRLTWSYSLPFGLYGLFQVMYWMVEPGSARWGALVAGAVILRGTLLIAWNRLMVSVLTRAELSYDSVIAEINALPSVPDLGRPFQVMISSTVADLNQERDAADRAITSLHLQRFRAETFGSISNTPRAVCEFMARSCDILILIIGDRYGHVIQPETISVVEFEFTVARAADPSKILVYVKDIERADEHLSRFVRDLEDFDRGYFRSVFRTPEELYERIHIDIARWLTRRAGSVEPVT